MSDLSNLSPQQFVAQHADFDRWAKQEHAALPPEQRFSCRAGDLLDVRTSLEDHYSPNVNGRFGMPHEEIMKQVGVPLHEAIPRHSLHPLVDEYLSR